MKCSKGKASYFVSICKTRGGIGKSRLPTIPVSLVLENQVSYASRIGQKNSMHNPWHSDLTLKGGSGIQLLRDP